METKMDKIKASLSKWLKRTLIFVALLLLAATLFVYYGVYEYGVMAGRVIRVSKKGTVFKTYEGKINLETFGALKGASPIAESFDFSIEKAEMELIERLEAAALSGERVNLRFKKRYMKLPWRGETAYFATDVERIGDNP
jgi:hypothetical protein